MLLFANSHLGDSGILLLKKRRGLAARPPNKKYTFHDQVNFPLSIAKHEAITDPRCHVPSKFNIIPNIMLVFPL